MVFQWIQGHRDTDMEATWTLKSWLIIVESTIEGLKRDNEALGKDVARLEKELSLAKVRMMVTET